MAYDFREGADVTSVPAGAIDAQALAAAADLRLLGLSCRETAAAAAEFVIRNGTSASDPAVVFVKLASGESVREFFGEQGLKCPDGIFIDRIAGTFEVAVYSKQA